MNNNPARTDSGSGTRGNTKTIANTNTTNGLRADDLKGVWGGDHIAMEVTASGADISYDCAHGSIKEEIVPDREGKFVVKGVHVKEHPGPIRVNEDTSGQPAIYQGSIDGDTMTMTVKLSGSDETIGTFTLTRGKTGRVRKCG
jgi:hypothetical protein